MFDAGPKEHDNAPASESAVAPPLPSPPAPDPSAHATANTPLLSKLRSIGWRVLLALAATYVFFGSGPTGAKAALASLPPLTLVAVRGLVAGALLLA